MAETPKPPTNVSVAEIERHLKEGETVIAEYRAMLSELRAGDAKAERDAAKCAEMAAKGKPILVNGAPADPNANTPQGIAEKGRLNRILNDVVHRLSEIEPEWKRAERVKREYEEKYCPTRYGYPPTKYGRVCDLEAEAVPKKNPTPQ